MSVSIEVRDVAPVNAVGLELETALSRFGEDVTAAYGRIFELAAGGGARPAGPALCAYPDEEFDPNGFRAIAAVSFDRAVGGDRLRPVELPGGRAVVATVVGPYDELPQAWREALVWARDHGLRVSSTPYELYRVDPEHAPSPAELETDLVIPVA